MNAKLTFTIYAFFILVAQKLIFSDAITILSNKYPVFIFIYPLVILSLPIEFNRLLSLIIAFIAGLLIDVFNDTLGMNAFALLIMAYLRNPILNLLEPRQGYKPDSSSFRSYGVFWVLSYLSILLGIHILAFYSIDAFTFVYFKRILICTLLNLLASVPFGFLILILFKPK